MTEAPTAGPLAGLLVVDCSRMIPGAVLARNLLDLGARLIKVETPAGGDPLRACPPLVDGVGVGFCVYYRGAESLRLDLRSAEGIARLRRLLLRADLFIESFRPGTLDRWGLDLAGLLREHPRLLACSLPAYGDDDKRAAHDINLTGLTGVAGQLPGDRLRVGGGEDIPRVLAADVLTGLLATSTILAGLVRRQTTGRGGQLHQSMLSAPLPLQTWAWADRAAGGAGLLESTLAGRAPAYRWYRCADGKLLAVGCLEPKFWTRFCELIERPQLSTVGLDTGERGKAAADAVAERLAMEPRAHWLGLFAGQDVPVTAVHDLDEARGEAAIASAGLLERTPMPDGGTLSVPGPALPAVGRTPQRPAPKLGEHDEAILSELLGIPGTPPTGAATAGEEAGGR